VSKIEQKIEKHRYRQNKKAGGGKLGGDGLAIAWMVTENENRATLTSCGRQAKNAKKRVS